MSAPSLHRESTNSLIESTDSLIVQLIENQVKQQEMQLHALTFTQIKLCTYIHVRLHNCTCCINTYNFIIPDVLLGTAGLDNSENSLVNSCSYIEPIKLATRAIICRGSVQCAFTTWP